ncbi:ATP-dependent RecD-like DNA helicase [Kistimonas scapharcae]|uniref:ATP-dependent RecD2 DNA helicase n=2 Tax=Kistimonas scapharcae TaxID=1036133 RepID=A0ABP8UXE4_9GAMM
MATGHWNNHPLHGWQFEVAHVSTTLPDSPEGIRRFLASEFRHIGPCLANTIVAHFGTAFFSILEQTPERLTEVKGIGNKLKERLITTWPEKKAIRTLMHFLREHNISATLATRLHKHYGEEAIHTVQQNPYQLAVDIRGIGFKTADALANLLGIAPDSLMRARAGVRHCLQTFTGRGHCARARNKLIRDALKLLGDIPATVITAAIEAEIRAKHLIPETIDDTPCLFTASLYHAECGVARQVHRLRKGATTWAAINLSRAIPWAETRKGIKLSPSQQQAVTLSVQNKVCILTGGPGVGKTTVVNCIVSIVAAKSGHISLCAPTGRAARRLSESTGRPAKTIHRLLEIDPSGSGYKYSASNPLATDMLVVDEASMVDIVLMNRLLQAIPSHAAVLLVGDTDQLPSVGPGAVLTDLIHAGCIPVARLTEIHRQAATSAIVTCAHGINRGRPPEPTSPDTLTDCHFFPEEDPEQVLETLQTIVSQWLPQQFGLDPVRDIQVLTPGRKGTLGTESLNRLLQHRLNHNLPDSGLPGQPAFAPGDKVIQTVNNYERDVFNGDIGTVITTDSVNEAIIIRFEENEVSYPFGELDELSLAYAITIHKSQGSEYPCVVIPVTTQHYPLLERNLLYTGITRGRQRVVLIGQPQAVTMATHIRKSSQRLTLLRSRLRQGESCR